MRIKGEKMINTIKWETRIIRWRIVKRIKMILMGPSQKYWMNRVLWKAFSETEKRFSRDEYPASAYNKTKEVIKNAGGWIEYTPGGSIYIHLPMKKIKRIEVLEPPDESRELLKEIEEIELLNREKLRYFHFTVEAETKIGSLGPGIIEVAEDKVIGDLKL